MEDEPNPPLKPLRETDLRKAAEQLADQLENVSLEKLTPRQYALYVDAEGLLQGIAQGRISVGQGRIRDDLVECVGLFGERMDRPFDKRPEHGEARETILRLLNVIGGAAIDGLSVDGFEILPRRAIRGRDQR